MIGECILWFFFCQAEGGIRYLVRSGGLGDGYKRQVHATTNRSGARARRRKRPGASEMCGRGTPATVNTCLLYTSDAADERSSVDLGGRRIIKKKKTDNNSGTR